MTELRFFSIKYTHKKFRRQTTNDKRQILRNKKTWNELWKRIKLNMNEMNELNITKWILYESNRTKWILYELNQTQWILNWTNEMNMWNDTQTMTPPLRLWKRTHIAERTTDYTKYGKKLRNNLRKEAQTENERIENQEILYYQTTGSIIRSNIIRRHHHPEVQRTRAVKSTPERSRTPQSGQEHPEIEYHQTITTSRKTDIIRRKQYHEIKRDNRMNRSYDRISDSVKKTFLW